MSLLVVEGLPSLRTEAICGLATQVAASQLERAMAVDSSVANGLPGSKEGEEVNVGGTAAVTRSGRVKVGMATLDKRPAHAGGEAEAEDEEGGSTELGPGEREGSTEEESAGWQRTSPSFFHRVKNPDAFSKVQRPSGPELSAARKALNAASPV